MYIIPLTEFDPPKTLPRGAGMVRPSANGSGSVVNPHERSGSLEGIAPGQRHRDPQVFALVVARLQQQHAERRIFAQARGQYAAGRPAADDDVVEALHPGPIHSKA